MDNDKNFTDVIIVGAGLSGIGAAYHIKHNCPNHSFKILEARASIGGTWDLFQYPGIRSDSDMFTLGYKFKPWIADEAIADGPAILDYIKETAVENEIEQHILFNNEVTKASWTSASSRWMITVQNGSTNKEGYHWCRFLYICSGYYDYKEGYTPKFKNSTTFKGELIHPQFWPQDLNYRDKRIIVIGSGATAVTLVPQLAKTAKHVIMLQRSPTYVLSAPQKDRIANFLRSILPSSVAYALSRWKNILMSIAFFNACRKWPTFFKKLIMKGAAKELGPEYDVQKHFGPNYNPWDQRLCLVPDNDLFTSIKEGKADVITEQIDQFVEKGILLSSGEIIEADIIVTATGLKIKVLGGMSVTVDEKTINPSETYCYRGMMFSGIPNAALAFGYTNASWTLKADLVSEYICRLLHYMEENGYKSCTPQMNDPEIKDEPFLDFSSGYIYRADGLLPKQGNKRPWKVFQNYILDLFNYKYSPIKDSALKFE